MLHIDTYAAHMMMTLINFYYAPNKLHGVLGRLYFREREDWHFTFREVELSLGRFYLREGSLIGNLIFRERGDWVIYF